MLCVSSMTLSSFGKSGGLILRRLSSLGVLVDQLAVDLRPNLFVGHLPQLFFKPIAFITPPQSALPWLPGILHDSFSLKTL